MIRKETQSGNPVRTATALNVKLNKGLVAYVAAASAAGVGMLAWTQPAGAEVVYTPTTLEIGAGQGPVNLDLNNDGVVDFYLSNFDYGCFHNTCGFDLNVAPAQEGNAIWAMRDGRFLVATPAFEGVVIAPERNFKTELIYLDFFQWRYGYPTESYGWWGKGKPFAGPYLGLKFGIEGEVHYGWARLKVKADRSGNTLTITATLTGYAYETVPNRPIITGMTHVTLDPDEIHMNPAALEGSTTSRPSTLGRLALGAIGGSTRPQESKIE
jgi:hypothetical protein